MCKLTHDFTMFSIELFGKSFSSFHFSFAVISRLSKLPAFAISFSGYIICGFHNAKVQNSEEEDYRTQKAAIKQPISL